MLDDLKLISNTTKQFINIIRCFWIVIGSVKFPLGVIGSKDLEIPIPRILHGEKWFSISDLPMAEFAKSSHLIRGDRFTHYLSPKKSLISLTNIFW